MIIKQFPKDLLPENTLNVHSIFKSIQGEGIHSGRETLFIRLSGCPFRCSYCDEKQSLIPKENNITSFENILSKIDDFLFYNSGKYIEFTGGSPEWQQDNLIKLIKIIKERFNDSAYISIQASGGILIEEPEIYDSIKVDYKHNIPFVNDFSIFDENDEIKFVIGPNSFTHNEFIKLMYKISDYIKANIIITAESSLNENVLSEVSRWKDLTEWYIDNVEIFNKHKIIVLPRLQQLYWYNMKNK